MAAWTDNPATSSTRIRRIHINELRRTVDARRVQAGLGLYGWTDGPAITSGMHIRAIHFSEIKTAIEQYTGSLGAWTAGTPPSNARQVKWSDINNLRSWAETFSQVLGQPTGVINLISLNGLHWQSPVQADSSSSQAQVRAGTANPHGFGSVLILSHAGTPPDGEQYSTADVDWLTTAGNMTCRPNGVPISEVVIARLYDRAAFENGAPTGYNLNPDPVVQAAKWSTFIQHCQARGVVNFVVLNEPNLEYPGPSVSPALWNPTNPTYMTQLAQALRVQNPSRPIYLGFPGPGNVNVGSGFYPGEANWNQYWNDYAPAMNSYDFVALHPYGLSLSSLQANALDQSKDIVSRPPPYQNSYLRFTEYGIPIAIYGTRGDAAAHARRGTDYATFVNWVRSPAFTGALPGKYISVLACHAFIAMKSPNFGTSSTEDYQIMDGEAQNLADSVGCVGQYG